MDTTSQTFKTLRALAFGVAKTLQEAEERGTFTADEAEEALEDATELKRRLEDAAEIEEGALELLLAGRGAGRSMGSASVHGDTLAGRRLPPGSPMRQEGRGDRG